MPTTNALHFCSDRKESSDLHQLTGSWLSPLVSEDGTEEVTSPPDQANWICPASLQNVSTELRDLRSYFAMCAHLAAFTFSLPMSAKP